MDAKILSNNAPPGSTPQDTPPIWRTVGRRKLDEGKPSTFVQGHLLNDNLGGPGRAYNLAPMTRIANSGYLSRPEERLKKLVQEENKVFRFHSEVEYGGHPNRMILLTLANPPDVHPTPDAHEKMKILAYEQEYMPTEFTWWYQELRYDGAQQKWVDDPDGAFASGSLNNELPEGDFVYV
jgi:hypothetical protein